MSYLFWIHIVLAIMTSGLLLIRPYLRLTSLGWFIGIWLVPILGPLFFLLLVIRLRHHKLPSAYQALHQQYNKVLNENDCIAAADGFLPCFPSANTRLLIDNEFIEALLVAIDQARYRIWITTYIFSGNIKQQIIERLQAASSRGVEVRLIVDRLGSGLFLFSKKTRKLYEALPFETQIFHPTLWQSLLFIEKRLHAKIVTIDGSSAFIGSHNLRDEVVQSNSGAVYNLSVFFQGALVQQVDALFADFWPEDDEMKQVLKQQSLEKTEITPLYEFEQDGVGRIFFSDPVNHTVNYNSYLTTLMVAAKKRILIWTPYMIPSQAMRNILIAQSRLGLDVRVLISKKTDSILVDNTHKLILNELVNHGVQCAMNNGQFDHSKVLIIDDKVIAGSANMDYRSLFRNYEANIEIKNSSLLMTITEYFNQYFAEAETVKKMHINPIKNILYQSTSLIAGLY